MPPFAETSALPRGATPAGRIFHEIIFLVKVESPERLWTPEQFSVKSRNLDFPILHARLEPQVEPAAAFGGADDRGRDEICQRQDLLPALHVDPERLQRLAIATVRRRRRRRHGASR